MEILTRSRSEWPDDAPVEVVERKGLGHPDTLCDAIAERVCISLCSAYRERFGAILHHNVDKVLLCAGASRPSYGGGEIVQPIEVILAGRATVEWRGVRVPVDELAIAACREVLAERLPLHDEIRVISRIRPGSGDLRALFARGTKPLANDTSCGVGFAPLTELERIVLDADRALADPQTRAAHPELGRDTKVMGVRRHDQIDLTVACAFIDRYLEDAAAYVQQKREAAKLVLAAASRASPLDTSVVLNAADDEATGSVFLTVTGSSAEAGDDGEVGRGNRINGLITPLRPMTIEAAAGKNPVNHVGKLYNVVADRIARSVVAECPEETLAATCMLVSRIGEPIDEPALIDVTICATVFDRVRLRIEEIVHAELARFEQLRDELVAGTLALYEV